MFGDPTVMKEDPSAGETWMYFLAPWGVQMELVTYHGKAYEKDFKSKLWDPTAPGKINSTASLREGAAFPMKANPARFQA